MLIFSAASEESWGRARPVARGVTRARQCCNDASRVRGWGLTVPGDPRPATTPLGSRRHSACTLQATKERLLPGERAWACRACRGDGCGVNCAVGALWCGEVKGSGAAPRPTMTNLPHGVRAWLFTSRLASTPSRGWWWWLCMDDLGLGKAQQSNGRNNPPQGWHREYNPSCIEASDIHAVFVLRSLVWAATRT